MKTISKIAVHHSASTFGDAATFRRWHRLRGWSDIGYHAVVLNGARTAGGHNKEEVGLVEPGRSVELVGAHTLGHNTGSLGLCVVGNFEAGGAPDLMQWRAAVEHVKGWCQRFKVSPGCVLGHREFPGQGTACPGRNFAMPEFRRDVARALEVPEPRLVRGVIRLGDEGEDVRRMQTLLRADGAMIDVDGIWGPQTEGAVGAYQRKVGLVEDRVCGPMTWGALLGMGV